MLSASLNSELVLLTNVSEVTDRPKTFWLNSSTLVSFSVKKCFTLKSMVFNFRLVSLAMTWVSIAGMLLVTSLAFKTKCTSWDMKGVRAF